MAYMISVEDYMKILNNVIDKSDSSLQHPEDMGSMVESVNQNVSAVLQAING